MVLTGCAGGALSRTQTVRLSDLETAPAHYPTKIRRCFVEDPAALQPLVHPLGRRLGLVEVRNADEWRQLAQAVPDVGACPDLRRGIVIGLVSWAGTPVDGGAPFRLQAIRIYREAGLVEVQFNSGTYLADGTAYLETVYVDGLRAVLVVTVDGLEYVAR